MLLFTTLSGCLLALLLPLCHGYSDLDSITDSLLREISLNRGSADDTLRGFPFEDYNNPFSNVDAVDPPQQQQKHHQNDGKDYPNFDLRRDAFLAHEPAIRDQEYLQHSSLFGAQSMQGGAGEGKQMLGPDGSIPNVEVIKSDTIIPAYCNPANPCPIGYTASDGCLEEKFSNTPEFSREYQAAQDCMCDSEHMFDCPGSTRENEINALARSFEKEDLAESTLNRIMQNIEPSNPLLEGEKLPVVAKKAPMMSVK